MTDVIIEKLDLGRIWQKTGWNEGRFRYAL